MLEKSPEAMACISKPEVAAGSLFPLLSDLAEDSWLAGSEGSWLFSWLLEIEVSELLVSVESSVELLRVSDFLEGAELVELTLELLEGEVGWSFFWPQAINTDDATRVPAKRIIHFFIFSTSQYFPVLVTLL